MTVGYFRLNRLIVDEPTTSVRIFSTICSIFPNIVFADMNDSSKKRHDIEVKVARFIGRHCEEAEVGSGLEFVLFIVV